MGVKGRALGGEGALWGAASEGMGKGQPDAGSPRTL